MSLQDPGGGYGGGPGQVQVIFMFCIIFSKEQRVSLISACIQRAATKSSSGYMYLMPRVMFPKPLDQT